MKITITPHMAKNALADMERWQAREARLEDEMKKEYAAHLEGVAKAIFADAERLRAIESMGPNGTIRIDDERGLAPRYIHWGGSTGLTLRKAIDKAKEPEKS